MKQYKQSGEKIVDCYEASEIRRRNLSFTPNWAWPDHSANFVDHYTDRKTSWKAHEIVRLPPRC